MWAFPLHYFHVPVRPKCRPQDPVLGDQVSHRYKTRGKIVVLCILIRIILNSKLEDGRLHIER